MAEDTHFQHWRFNPDTRALFDGTQTVTLEPRVASLLEYFLAHPDELLSHNQLVEAVWDGRVVSDDAVRHAVSVLRHALGDDHQQWIETVHKKGYISRFASPEVTVGSASATNADTTPAGGAAPGTRQNFSRRLVFILVLLLIPMTTGYWWLQRQQPTQPDSPATTVGPYTIAVLPFAMLGGDDQPDEFAAGLVEELRDTLSRYSAFRVTARGSSQRFAGGQVDPQEAGRELGVDFLVEGTVRRQREMLRISAALVDTRTGFRKWTETYDATWEKLFEVQQQIATSVARALQVVLVQRREGAIPRHTPASAEAHRQYLLGQQNMTSWLTADFDRAIAHFRRAIELDPDYAGAYARLADAIIERDTSTVSMPMQASTKALVKKLVDKALALDPGLGEAYAARSYLYDNTDIDAIEADLRRAIELNPSYSHAFEDLSMVLSATGRYDEAFFMIDQARSLNPLWPRHYHMKAYLHADLGQWRQARALEQEALRLEPSYAWALIGLGRIEAFQGNFAEGLRYMEQAYSLDPGNQHLAQRLAIYYLSVGDLATAQNLNRRAKAKAEFYFAAFANNYRDIGESLAKSGEMATVSPLEIYVHTDLLLRLALAENVADWALHVAVSGYGMDHVPPDLQDYQPIQLNLALLMYVNGDRERAQRLIAVLREHMPPAASSRAGLRVTLATFGRAIAAAVLGETSTALDALEYALEDRNPWWWWLRGHPAFDRLRENPRYQAFVAGVESHAARQHALLDEMRREGSIPDRREIPAAADATGHAVGPETAPTRIASD